MYWHQFGLNAEPFSLTPDPAFLYMSEGHAEALAALKLGLLERRGLLAMIGEVGTGKTTLLYSLLAGLDAEIKTAYVSNTRLSFDAILRSALRDFGLKPRGTDRLEMLECLNDFLLECAEEDTTAALIIDEAQNLSTEAFEEIRLLSNFETYTTKLLQIVLVGQPELATKLNDRGLRQINERIAVRCHLNPLNYKEAKHYIEHRVEAAGGAPELFSSGAMRRIIDQAQGIPRRINILCHNALLFTYGRNAKTVSPAIVDEAIRDQEGAGLRRFDVPAANGKRRGFAAGAGTGAEAGRLGSRVALAGWLAAGLLVGSLATWIFTSQSAFRTTAASLEMIDSVEAAATAEPVPAADLVASDEPEAGINEAADEATLQAVVEPENAKPAVVEERRATSIETFELPPAVRERVERALAELRAAKEITLQETAVAPEAGQAAEDRVDAVEPAAVATRPHSPGNEAPRPATPKLAAQAPVATPAPLAATEPEPARPGSPTGQKASDGPENGQQLVTVPAGTTLSDLMVGVYGGYNRELLQLVTTANPHIDNPNQIIAGDEIRFPTVEEPTGDSAATKKDE